MKKFILLSLLLSTSAYAMEQSTVENGSQTIKKAKKSSYHKKKLRHLQDMKKQQEQLLAIEKLRLAVAITNAAPGSLGSEEFILKSDGKMAPIKPHLLKDQAKHYIQTYGLELFSPVKKEASAKDQ